MPHTNLQPTDATTGETDTHELTGQELDRVTGSGEAITFNYGSLAVQYVAQHADGTTK